MATIELRESDMHRLELIDENQELRIYRYNTVGGWINVYQFKNGELTFGSEKASTLNRFEKTQVYEAICRVLTHNYPKRNERK